jgi:hypothetical protein
MSAASKIFLRVCAFLILSYLVGVSIFGNPWSLSFHTADMESLETSFIVEIDGTPIAQVSDDTKDRTQATTGSKAAVFTLKNGRLQSGDWLLGRNRTEDRSMLPKQVLWFPMSEDSEKLVKPVTAHQDGDSYQLKFGGPYLKELSY